MIKQEWFKSCEGYEGFESANELVTTLDLFHNSGAGKFRIEIVRDCTAPPFGARYYAVFYREVEIMASPQGEGRQELRIFSRIDLQTSYGETAESKLDGAVLALDRYIREERRSTR